MFYSIHVFLNLFEQESVYVQYRNIYNSVMENSEMPLSQVTRTSKINQPVKFVSYDTLKTGKFLNIDFGESAIVPLILIFSLFCQLFLVNYWWWLICFFSFSGDVGWKCDVCNIKLSSKECLRRHVLSKHIKLRIHQCCCCPKKFVLNLWVSWMDCLFKLNVLIILWSKITIFEEFCRYSTITQLVICTSATILLW